MFIGQCLHDITVSHGLLISLFLAGLVGSFTHCSTMCAPFVLAQSGSNDSEFRKTMSFLLIPYHMGRMTTYIFLAILLNSVINLAFLYSDLKSLIAAPILAFAGILFLVNAFPKLANFFPWALRIRLGVPYRYIARFSSRFIGDTRALSRYVLGVFLGFMPCGLVISALLASTAAPSAHYAGLGMMSFALGTMPALSLIALGGQAVQTKYPLATKRLSQGAMVLSSFWLFALAGILIF